jgi:hypothetical protein
VTIRDDILAIPDAKLRTGAISADYLVFMDFLDTPKRWWTGWGDIESGGYTWRGIGNMIGISDLPSSYSPSADQITMTLQSATQEMMTLSQEASTRVYGRDITVSHQFFDVAPDNAAAQPWTPLGPSFVLYAGRMDQMTFKASRDNDGNTTRSIELTAEGLFTNRNAPPNGRWSDADQKRRFPADEGCDRMHIYANYSPTWTV